MLELLESRIAPALTAVTLHNVLTLKGTPFGTTITISELAGGKVKIDDSGGSGFAPIGGVDTIVVLLSDTPGTNDTIDLHFDEGFIHFVGINPGGGENTVNFVSGGSAVAARVVGGEGKDHVDIQSGANVRSLTVKPGQGDNSLAIEGRAGAVTYIGGDDVDTVTLAASAVVGGLTAEPGGNSDVVTLNGRVDGRAYVSASAGADQVTVGATADLGSLTVVGGTENDIVNISGHVAGALSINVGTGDDQVTLQPSNSAKKAGVILGSGLDTMYLGGTFTGAVGVSAGADMDTVNLSNGLSVGSVLGVSLGSGNNTLSSATATSSALNHIGTLVISGSTGDDNVSLQGVAVTNGITVNLGSGTNYFAVPNRIAGSEIAAITATKLSYTGGSGKDTIAIASSQSLVERGLFTLGGGDDTVSFTISKSIFTNQLKTYGAAGDDTFMGKNLFTAISAVYSSIENLS